jgi:hypothetical protein
MLLEAAQQEATAAEPGVATSGLDQTLGDPCRRLPWVSRPLGAGVLTSSLQPSPGGKPTVIVVLGATLSLRCTNEGVCYG